MHIHQYILYIWGLDLLYSYIGLHKHPNNVYAGSRLQFTLLSDGIYLTMSISIDQFKKTNDF